MTLQLQFKCMAAKTSRSSPSKWQSLVFFALWVQLPRSEAEHWNTLTFQQQLMNSMAAPVDLVFDAW